jgi:meso-butanediol dehydrogenase/(S,S)-butanediol dehydrogenase/diacetyl reductase
VTARVVLVTGAASGIGRATAERFLADGDTVAALDLHPSVPDGATFHECDVSSALSVAAAVAAVVEAHGRLDVVANVAGVLQMGRFEDISEAEWTRVLAVNLTGPFLVSQAALPHLRATKGCIVNVASVAGLQGQAYTAAYCASKGGVVLLTKALAVELSPEGIRVNCVCPGGVDTPMLGALATSIPPDADRRLMERLQMLVPGGLSTPAHVAAAIAFLASPEALFITGTALPLDGGITA